MGQREDAGRKGQPQRALLLGRPAGLDHALHDLAALSPALVMIVVRKRRGGGGSSRASTPSDAERSSGPSLASRLRSNSTSSLPLAGRCAYSEEMIARVLTVKSMTDWKVRIGGASASWPLARLAPDLLLQGLRQLPRLARAVDRERVVLERVELGQDAQPGGLREVGQKRRQAGEAGKARERGDADHRRDQDDAVGARELRILERVERIFHGERAAVGEPDQMQRPTRPDPPARLAHRQPGGGQPVFPLRPRPVRSGRCRGRQPDRDRDVAVRAVAARDVTQAVGRVRQPVQEHHRADRGALRLQHVGPVPVLREVARIHRAALEIAVDRDTFCRVQFRRDLGAHVVERRLLGREVLAPIGLIDFVRAQFGRRVGMPELERGPRCVS